MVCTSTTYRLADWRFPARREPQRRPSARRHLHAQDGRPDGSPCRPRALHSDGENEIASECRFFRRFFQGVRAMSDDDAIDIILRRQRSDPLSKGGHDVDGHVLRYDTRNVFAFDMGELLDAGNSYEHRVNGHRAGSIGGSGSRSRRPSYSPASGKPRCSAASSLEHLERLDTDLLRKPEPRQVRIEFLVLDV